LEPIRIYLTGRVLIEHGDVTVGERELAGRQGRIAFVYLAAHRTRAIGRSELASAIWGDDVPGELESALNAILSKLRNALRRAGLVPPDAGIDARSGSIELRLPADSWIDLEAAANAIDEAEGTLRRGETGPAWALANIVVAITRRPLLADLEAPWIETRRSAQRSLLVRGLECLAEVSRANREPHLAIQHTAEILDLEPFRETAYQRLMQLHAASGNRAEALRVFARCRELLRDELGTSPSPATEAVFLEILRDGTA
jgi:DNA-binding SARP family transcriptional activator